MQIVALILLGLVSPPLAAAPSPATLDWHEFGRALRYRLPTGAPCQHAVDVAEAAAEKLAALGITPNFDQSGRDAARRRFSDSSLGTCGHTTACLRLACLGAGLPASNLKTAVVLKRQLDGSLPLELNADHCALVLLAPQGPIVFDLWCDGRDEKTFLNFKASVWKGMPLAEWTRRMAEEGYVVASCEEHPELAETTPVALPELFRKMAGKAHP